MSIESDYIRAAQSSHLEWKPTPSDIDRVIAAGKVTETLGTRLLRLRSNADAFSAATEGPVMLGLLRGYPETLAMLTAHAKAMHTERLMRGTDTEAMRSLDTVVYNVLSLFLQPNCPQCEGTGYTGMYGAPRLRCVPCRETGKRQLKWKSDEEERFARALQASMDEKIANALRVMARWLER